MAIDLSSDRAAQRTPPPPPSDVPAEPDEVAFRPRSRPSETGSVGGAGLAALAFTWIGYERVLPFSGAIGFCVCWYLVFLLFVIVALALDGDGRDVVDRLVRIVVQSGGLLVVAALGSVVVFTVYRGVKAMRWSFLTETMAFTAPADPLDRGGVLAAMVGTLEQVGLATLFTVPLGIATAVFLNEVRGPITRPVRTIIDAMSALPSVVAGLFIYAVVVLSLGFGRSGFAASLALSIMMLPIITRASEVVLRLVPDGLREASLALGAPQWRTVLTVVLPTVRSGLYTAVILGVARGVGETAPVLLTSGYTAELNANPLQGQQVSLPLFIYNFVRLPQFDQVIARAYGAALTLLVIVLVLFVVARWLSRRGPGGSSRRRRRIPATPPELDEPVTVGTVDPAADTEPHLWSEPSVHSQEGKVNP